MMFTAHTAAAFCRRFILKAAALLLSGVLTWPSVSAAQSAAPPRTMEEVGKKIEMQKEQLQKVTAQETLTLEKLDEIERRLDYNSGLFDNMSMSIDALQERIAAASARMSALQKDRFEKELHLKKRLVASYKYYRRGVFKILLSASTYAAFLRQERFLQDVVAYDRTLFMDCRYLINAEMLVQDMLQQQREEYRQSKESLLRQRDTIRASRHEKVALLESIRQKKNLQLKALKELEQFAAEMQQLVDSMPQGQETYSGSHELFSSRAGKLCMPLQGKILSAYGPRKHPELNITTFQKGIEIECLSGTEIRAVYNGRVVFAGWFKGYGNTMIIDHGENYFSLIAHASRLLKSVGDVVAEGDPIALSGDTGSLKGALLYFEIRHHGKPQDPLLWLDPNVT